MKTYISIFPIDEQLQGKLGVYTSGYIEKELVGRILHDIIEAGYTEINSFVESYDQINRLVFHCRKV